MFVALSFDFANGVWTNHWSTFLNKGLLINKQKRSSDKTTENLGFEGSPGLRREGIYGQGTSDIQGSRPDNTSLWAFLASGALWCLT